MLDRAKCLEFATILQDKVVVDITKLGDGVSIGALKFPSNLEEDEVHIFGVVFSFDQRQDIVDSILEDAMEFKSPCYAFFLAHTIYHALDESGETKH